MVPVHHTRLLGWRKKWPLITPSSTCNSSNNIQPSTVPGVVAEVEALEPVAVVVAHHIMCHPIRNIRTPIIRCSIRTIRTIIIITIQGRSIPAIIRSWGNIPARATN